ncbi:MAG: ankyrin repeat domain-containing protein [Acidobacteriota bacterium]
MIESAHRVNLRPLPFRAPLSDYQRQAEELHDGHRAKAPDVLALIHRCHPRFLDERIPWLPKDVLDSEIAAARFDLADARTTVARHHSFTDWPALEEWVAALQLGGGVTRFESAVEAAIDGDLPALESALRHDPDLVSARSTRRTCLDPPVHQATILHYVAANGVESHRQRTPRNAVAVARTLLERGAIADALAGFYGCECATLSLLVSSSPPAEAGLQVELAELLLDHGAAIEGHGESWGTPLLSALLFGFPRAADALVRRGAHVGVAAAAGLGLAEDLGRMIPGSDSRERHLGLALAAQLGHAETVRILLDSGEDPDRFNPEGSHAHATPLHHAALHGHLDVVKLLVERGARLDIADRIYKGTPLGWARHEGQHEVEAFLRSRGAP